MNVAKFYETLAEIYSGKEGAVIIAKVTKKQEKETEEAEEREKTA